MFSPNYSSTDDYISRQDSRHFPALNLIRTTIRETVPEAVETISYQMPSFKYHGMLCYFAVFKNHYSLFVSPEVRQAFDHDLSSFVTTKSAIHLPFGQPVPVKLIEEIIRFAAIMNLEKTEARKAKKRK